MSSKDTFVAFDVETTGLFPGVDRIVELGAVHFMGESVLDTWTCLVDPGIPIPSAASRVHGITDEMVRGMATTGEALPGFLFFLSRGTPVAHNAEFDVGFVTTAIIAAGLPTPEGPVLDTRGLARSAFPERISYSLGNLLRDNGVEVEAAHRALADAYSSRRLFLLCMDIFGRDNPPSVEGLVCLSGGPLDFGERAPRFARTAALLNRALRDGATVRISYLSSRGEVTERRIRPLSFSTAGGAVAIEAFCLLRNEKRTFRLEAISDVRAETAPGTIAPGTARGVRADP